MAHDPTELGPGILAFLAGRHLAALTALRARGCRARAGPPWGL